MPTTHIVKEGETLAGIALENGFYSWETIYNHPENQALRELRPDPSELYVGDRIYIPDKTPKSVEVEAFGPDDDDTKVYTFVRKSLKTSLSLYLEDDEGDYYANKDYEIKVTVDDQEESYTGTTDEEGKLVQAISPRATGCVVTLWPDKATAPQETITWEFEFGAMPPEGGVAAAGGDIGARTPAGAGTTPGPNAQASAPAGATPGGRPGASGGAGPTPGPSTSGWTPPGAEVRTRTNVP